MPDLSQIKPAGMPSLPARQNSFVVEYVKDFNATRAAERAGYANPAYGNTLLEEDDVQAMIHWFIGEMRHDAQINAEWVLWEAVDNHRIARQQGNLSASNTALKLVGQLASIDAFAASKVEHSLDDEVVERLNRGRERARLVDGQDSHSSPKAFDGQQGGTNPDDSSAESGAQTGDSDVVAVLQAGRDGEGDLEAGVSDEPGSDRTPDSQSPDTQVPDYEDQSIDGSESMSVQVSDSEESPERPERPHGAVERDQVVDFQENFQGEGPIDDGGTERPGTPHKFPWVAGGENNLSPHESDNPINKDSGQQCDTSEKPSEGPTGLIHQKPPKGMPTPSFREGPEDDEPSFL